VSIRGQVRERILDAALAVLREGATRRFAQPVVARTAGVPQGHLTYYFPKKLDLLIAVANRYAQLVARELAPFLRGKRWHEASPQEREDARTFVRTLVRDRERTRLLIRLISEADAEPALRGAVAEGAWFSRSTLARVIGIEPEHPDIEVLFAMFWGLGLQHMVFRDRRTEASLDAALDRAFEHFDEISRKHHGGAAPSGSHPFDDVDPE
jgi:AcrR family transcriptional regulator